MYRGLVVSLVLPSYNEREALARLLPVVPEWMDEVIVVDSSSDGSEQVAREMGARVIREEELGYGKAYRTGFMSAGGDVVVAMDADGTYPVEGMEPLLDCIVDGDFDFVSGSRFMAPLEPGVMPAFRLLGNRVVTAWANLLFPAQFTDVLSGMWVFRRPVLDRICLSSDNWNFSEEVKVACVTNGSIRFTERPIRYTPRIGTSVLSDCPLRLLKVGLGNIGFLSCLRFKALCRS